MSRSTKIDPTIVSTRVHHESVTGSRRRGSLTSRISQHGALIVEQCSSLAVTGVQGRRSRFFPNNRVSAGEWGERSRYPRGTKPSNPFRHGISHSTELCSPLLESSNEASRAVQSSMNHPVSVSSLYLLPDACLPTNLLVSSFDAIMIDRWIDRCPRRATFRRVSGYLSRS